ncbi:MAG: hypothetical protein U1F66_10795 [bacterium]
MNPAPSIAQKSCGFSGPANPPAVAWPNRRWFFNSLLLLSLLLWPAASWAKAQRISFKKGSTQAEVMGQLQGMKDQACFVARARRGQHMRVEISGDGALRGTLRTPSGGGEGQPGGLIFDGELTETGDYRICIEESPMGDAWNGKFQLKLVIQ